MLFAAFIMIAEEFLQVLFVFRNGISYFLVYNCDGFIFVEMMEKRKSYPLPLDKQ